MNISSQKNIKSIYKVTGTPENFLTALKFSVWGFNPERKADWKKLLPGDIIFFHSKGSDSKFVKKPKACIVGFGVVGNKFYEDETPLWIDEKLDGKTYPYRFGFSEIYLFAPITINKDWDPASLYNSENTKNVVLNLIEAGIPLSELDGFPIMGSYSPVKNALVRDLLLTSSKKLSFYMGDQDEEIITKSAGLSEFNDAAEALRYGTTLTFFEDIKQRIISEPNSVYSYNSDKLANAEKAHFDIVSHLRLVLAKKGYQVYNNNHVDLYAHNKQNGILIEAKSIENRNFKSQSRKGIVQLFEYNYFEISKFKQDQNLKFSKELNILATSDEPRDNEYISFINSLHIKTIAVKNKGIINYGDSVNVNNL